MPVFSSLFLNVWRLAGGGGGGGGLDKKRKEKKPSDKYGVVGLPITSSIACLLVGQNLCRRGELQGQTMLIMRDWGLGYVLGCGYLMAVRRRRELRR